jgi:acyl carrier protein
MVSQQANVTEAGIRAWCTDYLARTLQVPASQIEPDAKFARLGLDSATSVFLVVELEEWLGLELESNVVFEHPSIGELARYVVARLAAHAAKFAR